MEPRRKKNEKKKATKATDDSPRIGFTITDLECELSFMRPEHSLKLRDKFKWYKSEGGKRLNRIRLRVFPKKWSVGSDVTRDLIIELCLSDGGSFTPLKSGKIALIFDEKAPPVYRNGSYETSFHTDVCSGNVHGKTFKIKVRFRGEEDPKKCIFGRF